MDNKTVVIHQPDFMPWLGFFDRLLRSDIFVVLDDVQFLRRGWHHRDKIKTANGPRWLTVPVRSRGRYDQLIKDTEIEDSGNWRSKHLRILQNTYGKAAFFDEIIGHITGIYDRKHRWLIDLNMELMTFFLGYFEIETKLLFSSDLHAEGSKSARLVSIAERAGADVYLTGVGSKDYLEEDLFVEKGISVVWRAFVCPPYPQLHGPFVPGLSCLDFAMNCGSDLKGFLEKDAQENDYNSSGSNRVFSAAR